MQHWSSVKSVQDTFEKVPEDMRFKIILLSKGREVDRFNYKLKGGKELPAKITLMNDANPAKYRK